MKLNKFSLPQSWTISKLESIAEVIMGQSPPGDSYNNTGYGVPLINGPVEFGPTAFSKTIKSKFTTQPTKYCNQGDLVLCVRGSTTGRINIAGFDACIGRGVAAIRSFVSQAYINFFIHAIRRDIYDLGTGSTFPNVSSEIIKGIEVPLAPLNEQHRIVEAIETHFTRLDAAVAALKRAQGNLKRYRSSVLKAACEGRLVPTEAALAQAEGRSYESAATLLERILNERRRKWEADNPGKKYKEPVAPDTRDLPELPEGWCWGRVDQVADVGTGATPLRSRAEYYVDGTIPWVTSAVVNNPYVGVADEFITELALRETNTKVFPVGTLLIAMYGEGKTRGKVSELNIESATNQALAAILLEGIAQKVKSFLKIFFQENYEGIRRLSSGGVQPNLNLSIIKNTKVPIPPLAEQHRIVAEVERRLSLIDQLEKSIEADLSRAERLRQSILKRAFEGKLVPQDPNDEPASVLLERIRAEKGKT